MQLTCHQCGHVLDIPDQGFLPGTRCPLCNWKLELPKLVTTQPDGDGSYGDESQFEIAAPTRASEQTPVDEEEDSDDEKRLVITRFQILAAVFVIVVLLLYASWPVMALHRHRASNARARSAIAQAQEWISSQNSDPSKFTKAYEDLQRCILDERVDDEHIPKLQELLKQVISHRDQLMIEQKLVQAKDETQRGELLKAKQLLLEYLVSGRGEKEDEARDLLAQVNSGLE